MFIAGRKLEKIVYVLENIGNTPPSGLKRYVEKAHYLE